MIINIGIDIDGVLANTPARVVEYAGQVFKVPMSVEQLTEWDQLGTLVKSQATQMFNDPDFYGQIQPIDRAPEFTQHLQAIGCDNWIVTSRPHELWKTTMDWLSQNGIAWRFIGHERDKAKTAKRWRIKFFVEDNLENANALAKVCKVVLLINWPYNQGPTAPNVARVASLREAQEILSVLISQEGR